MIDTDQYLTTLKILIIGESGVGKSCLLLRFCEDDFRPDLTTTIGVDFKAKTLELDGNKIKLALWDTAGQERFRALTPSYYRDAHGAILVYDVTCIDSFKKLTNWLEELNTYSTKANLVKMVVGTKIDLLGRKVEKEEGLRFAARHQAMYLETSAAENIGVQIAFEELVRKVLQTPDLWDNARQLHLSDHPEGSQERSGGCC